MGRGVGVTSVRVNWQKKINRETATALLCLLFTVLVALATATPDWSKGQ